MTEHPAFPRKASAQLALHTQAATHHAARDDLPGYGAHADQAEQLRSHYDSAERVELAEPYGTVISVIEGETERMVSP